MPGRLEGKVAIVTGASSGIGKATALAYAREGAAVVLAARRRRETEATALAVREAGGRAIVVPTDVARAAEVSAMVDATLAAYGRLDIAFNNAGVFGAEGPVHGVAEDYWDRLMDINLKGTWLCMKHEIPPMLEKGAGVIVNMSSTAGLAGWADAPLYAASKFGVVGLTRSAALQYATAGIRINAICPAFTRIESIDDAVAQHPGADGRMRASIPLGRLGTVEEIAEAVVWLSSDASSFCVGNALALDGGQTIGLW